MTEIQRITNESNLTTGTSNWLTCLSITKNLATNLTRSNSTMLKGFDTTGQSPSFHWHVCVGVDLMFLVRFRAIKVPSPCATTRCVIWRQLHWQKSRREKRAENDQTRWWTASTTYCHRLLDSWTKSIFWFFDVRVFDRSAQKYRGLEVGKCFRRNEMEKKRHYNERVTAVDNGIVNNINKIEI